MKGTEEKRGKKTKRNEVIAKKRKEDKHKGKERRGKEWQRIEHIGVGKENEKDRKRTVKQ